MKKPKLKTGRKPLPVGEHKLPVTLSIQSKIIDSFGGIIQTQDKATTYILDEYRKLSEVK